MRSLLVLLFLAPFGLSDNPGAEGSGAEIPPPPPGWNATNPRHVSSPTTPAKVNDNAETAKSAGTEVEEDDPRPVSDHPSSSRRKRDVYKNAMEKVLLWYATTDDKKQRKVKQDATDYVIINRIYRPKALPVFSDPGPVRGKWIPDSNTYKY